LKEIDENCDSLLSSLRNRAERIFTLAAETVLSYFDSLSRGDSCYHHNYYYDRVSNSVNNSSSKHFLIFKISVACIDATPRDIFGDLVEDLERKIEQRFEDDVAPKLSEIFDHKDDKLQQTFTDDCQVPVRAKCMLRCLSDMESEFSSPSSFFLFSPPSTNALGSVSLRPPSLSVSSTTAAAVSSYTTNDGRDDQQHRGDGTTKTTTTISSKLASHSQRVLEDVSYQLSHCYNTFYRLTKQLLGNDPKYVADMIIGDLFIWRRVAEELTQFDTLRLEGMGSFADMTQKIERAIDRKRDIEEVVGQEDTFFIFPGLSSLDLVYILTYNMMI
jgi:hypothetical protein